MLNMRGLPKEESVKLHRELWDWLSKNPNKNKSDWPRWKDFDKEDALYYLHCFACSYSWNKDCDKCLLIWPGISCCSDLEDGDDGGIFNQWESEDKRKIRAKLAAQIRDLPIREDGEQC